MSPRHALVLLLLAVAVSGCDRITGAAEQKTKDAEAIGYACRVSTTAPADCIANNDTHSPTSLLAGWKAADQDILAKRLDPSMGTNPATAAHLPVAEAAASQVAATKTRRCRLRANGYRSGNGKRRICTRFREEVSPKTLARKHQQ